MQSRTKFENEIKDVISKKVTNIYPSSEMFNQIKNKMEVERNTVMNINKVKRPRGILIACIILILTTATCFAAIKIASYNSYSTNNDFLTFPSEKEMKEKAGFLPDYIEEFSNGFVFKSGGVGEVTSNDDSGKVVESTRLTTLDYVKGDKSVILTVEEKNIFEESSEGEKFVLSNGTEAIYSENMYKFLPPDYEMTEQDKQDEKNGTYVFSYGTTEIEINHIQSITWVHEGMNYNIVSSDDGVTKDDLVMMASEILEK